MFKIYYNVSQKETKVESSIYLIVLHPSKFWSLSFLSLFGLDFFLLLMNSGCFQEPIQFFMLLLQNPKCRCGGFESPAAFNDLMILVTFVDINCTSVGSQSCEPLRESLYLSLCILLGLILTIDHPILKSLVD